jgi:hypothetical protein
VTFREGLIKARSYIVFILGLAAAFTIIIKLEAMDIEKGITNRVEIKKSQDIPAGKTGRISRDEEKWARTAWRYFENNYRSETGLVNSVDGYQASTMWDTASYLMGLVSAYRLAIIPDDIFHQRLSSVLNTLAILPLFDDALPNKSYNTVSGQMVNYSNEKSKRGIGWSAIDIGRLLVPFNIIVWNYPEHTGEVRSILKRWKFEQMLEDGVMYGAAVDKAGRTVLLQEGRIGYEEYAAKSLSILGVDVSRALLYQDFLAFVDVYGIRVPYDSRTPEMYNAHNYVVSEPYILDGLEFGWDTTSREFAYRVYRAQEKRYAATGILTAVSEDNIDQPPYFVYNTVFTDGKTWNCITDQGEDASRFKTLSTKAVFGWHMLYGTPYTGRLKEAVKDLYDPEKGWYSGRYEASGQPNRAITCNTNAIVLESICYKKFGSLIQNR